MSLRCCGIACIDDSLCEMDHDSVAVRIRIEDVRRVTLGYGFQSPHPILQTIIGAILVLPGLFAILHLIKWSIWGGTFHAWEAGLIAFAVVGIWLLFTALAKGYYLDVETVQGRRRLAFDADATPVKLQPFLPTLDVHLAVPVESKVPSVPFTPSR